MKLELAAMCMQVSEHTRKIGVTSCYVITVRLVIEVLARRHAALLLLDWSLKYCSSSSTISKLLKYHESAGIEVWFKQHKKSTGDPDMMEKKRIAWK
jgi:hypothetical protein